MTTAKSAIGDLKYAISESHALFKLLSVVDKVQLYSAHRSKMLKNPISVDSELVV